MGEEKGEHFNIIGDIKLDISSKNCQHFSFASKMFF